MGISVVCVAFVGCIIACLRWYREEQSRYKEELITKALRLSDKGRYEQAAQILVEGLSKRVLLKDTVIIDILKSQNVLKGHSNAVTSATFSPDGKRIVTASGDDTAIIWILDDYLLIDCHKRKAERNPLSAEEKKEHGIKWWLKW